MSVTARSAPVQATLACGAWLKNMACRLDTTPGASPRWSELHGDLSDPRACAQLEASVQALSAQAQDEGARIALVAHDLHPDFHSTRVARQLAARLGVPALGVQHHHAHIAAVQAEHGLEQPVIGLALDGVGLGDDGQAWGGELLRVDGARMRRLGHLHPLALPGGDVAAREPWRMAAAALHAMGRGDEIKPCFAPVVGEPLAQGVARMLQRAVRSPLTTSMGRWFDAAAGALGLSVRQAHEAQAAVALQQAAQAWLADHGEPRHESWLDGIDTGAPVLDLRGLLERLFDVRGQNLMARTQAQGWAAACFHRALAGALADWAAAAARAEGLADVCLGGGCFLNPLLATRVSSRLQAHGLRVHEALRHTCGDAALALGQAWVARQALAAGCINPDGADAVAPQEMVACA